jgi:hypothetical protein
MENGRGGVAIDGVIGERRDLLLAGGCVHGCGHAIPRDVPWSSFVHYRERLASIA